MVEHQLPKLGVASSILVACSISYSKSQVDLGKTGILNVE